MCKQPVLAFYCSRPLIYKGPHIGFKFHEGNSEFNSEECNSDSNSNDGNSNSIPIPPGLGKANSNSIPIPELDLELARKSNSGAELTPTLVYIPTSVFSFTMFTVTTVRYNCIKDCLKLEICRNNYPWILTICQGNIREFASTVMFLVSHSVHVTCSCCMRDAF